MSTATMSYQCTMIRTLGMTIVDLRGMRGDVMQVYSGDDLDNVRPDIPTLTDDQKPVMCLVLNNSNQAVKQAKIQQMLVNGGAQAWYWNDRRILFGADRKSLGLAQANDEATLDGTTEGTYKNMFEMVPVTGTGSVSGAPYGGLRICKNYVKAADGVPPVVKVKFQLAPEAGSLSLEKHQASNTLQIVHLADGESSVCTIYCNEGESFILSDKNRTVTARVKLWSGSDLSEVDLGQAGHTVEWFLLAGGGWEAPESGVDSSARTFTITRDMVDVSGYVKVNVKNPESAVLASDIQDLLDESDAWVCEANPSPADGVMNYNNPSQTGVSFTPKIYSRETRQYATSYTYDVVVMDSAGCILNNEASDKGKTGGTSYEVKKEIFDSCPGDVGPLVIFVFYVSQ